MRDGNQIPDDELRKLLKEIDEDPNVDVSSFAADFIESVVYGDQRLRTLTERQRLKAKEIIDRYGR